MKYIIKNLKTGEYLRNGEIFFEWTPDIYYAKVFRGLQGANNTINKINRDRMYHGLNGEFKIFGIEMKEVEVA